MVLEIQLKLELDAKAGAEEVRRADQFNRKVLCRVTKEQVGAKG